MKKYFNAIKSILVYSIVTMLMGCSCGGGSLGLAAGNPDCNCSSESIDARIAVCRKKTDPIKDFLNSNVGTYTIIGLTVNNNNLTDSLTTNNIIEFIVQESNRYYKNSVKDMCNLKGSNDPDRYCLYYVADTYPLFVFYNHYSLDVKFNLVKVNENETNIEIIPTICTQNKLCSFMQFETNKEWIFKKNAANSFTFKSKNENIILSLTK